MRRNEAILEQIIHALIAVDWLMKDSEETLEDYAVDAIKMALVAAFDAGTLAGFTDSECAGIYEQLTGYSWNTFVEESKKAREVEFAQNRAIIAGGAQ